MKRNAAVLALAALPALALAGCRSVTYVEPPPIPVPAGLDANEVEFAILLAIADPPDPPKLSPGQRITDHVLDAVIWSYDSVEKPRNEPWYFEAREPTAILAGYQHGPLYMRVRVKYSLKSVSLSIVESRNFDQKGTKIHRGALRRLDVLGDRIRRSLGRMARRSSFGGPV